MLSLCTRSLIKKDFKKDFRLVNQIQAAAVSSMNNIAVIFTRKSGHVVKPSSCKAHTDKGSYIVEQNDDVVYYKIFQCIQRG